MAKKLKIKTKDRVIVIAGRDKGKTGEVLKVLPKEDRVIVRGINIARRHERPTRVSQGGIVDKEVPIHISNVAHVDPQHNLPTRVGYRVLEDGRKVRFAKRSGDVIDL